MPGPLAVLAPARPPARRLQQRFELAGMLDQRGEDRCRYVCGGAVVEPSRLKPVVPVDDDAVALAIDRDAHAGLAGGLECGDRLRDNFLWENNARHGAAFPATPCLARELV